MWWTWRPVYATGSEAGAPFGCLCTRDADARRYGRVLHLNPDIRSGGRTSSVRTRGLVAPRFFVVQFTWREVAPRFLQAFGDDLELSSQ